MINGGELSEQAAKKYYKEEGIRNRHTKICPICCGTGLISEKVCLGKEACQGCKGRGWIVILGLNREENK